MIKNEIKDMAISGISQNIYNINKTNDKSKITLNKNSNSSFLIINDGGSIDIDFDHLEGANSKIRIVNVYHDVPSKVLCKVNLNLNSTSNVYMLSLLTKGADIIANANIYIMPGANGASGKLLEENLILDSDIKNISAIPLLDVHNSQISASHGAKISKINDKDIFYMMSRGLSYDTTRSIIIDGYINNLLSIFDLSETETLEIKKLILR